MIILNYFKNFQQDIYYQEFQNLTPSLKRIRIILWKKWHNKDQTISQLSSQWVKDYITLQKVKPSIIRVSIKIDINIQKIVRCYQCVILYPYVWNVFKFYACNFLTLIFCFRRINFLFPFYQVLWMYNEFGDNRSEFEATFLSIDAPIWINN